MALLKLSDFDPHYHESFNGEDLKGRGVYTEGDQKVGTVNDVLVDEEGHFRYFLIDLGFWIFGKKVLLPVGRSRVDNSADRIYVVGMDREQAENLPEFNENTAIDYDYEERVRGVYRTPNTGIQSAGTASTPVMDAVAPIPPVDTTPIGTPAPLDAAATSRIDTTINQSSGHGVNQAPVPTGVTPTNTTSNRDSYNYQQEPSLYGLNDQNHQTLKLYEERLLANKKRVKTGEVAIGKRVETETATVAVPIEKERVVIERTTPVDAGKAVAPGSVDFREGEVAHVEIYEETADIRKEAVLREEVNVKKVVDRDTVTAQETLRREELDVDTTGTTVVGDSDRLPKDRI